MRINYSEIIYKLDNKMMTNNFIIINVISENYNTINYEIIHVKLIF